MVLGDGRSQRLPTNESTKQGCCFSVRRLDPPRAANAYAEVPFYEDHLSSLPPASSGGFATTCLEMPTTGHAAFAILEPSNMPIWG